MSNASVLAEQIEKVRDGLSALYLDNPSLFRLLGCRRMISAGSPAVYSIHDLARRLLELPDKEFTYDEVYDRAALFLEEEMLPEPRAKAVPAVYEYGTKADMAKSISYRPERIPFSLSSEKKE